MIAQRFVDIYAIVTTVAHEHKVYPNGRVFFWLDYRGWEEMDEDHPDYEAIRDAGLKAINEDKQ